MATKFSAAAPRTQLPQSRQPNRSLPEGFLPLVPRMGLGLRVTGHPEAESPRRVPQRNETQARQQQDAIPPREQSATQRKAQAAQEKTELNAARLSAAEAQQNPATRAKIEQEAKNAFKQEDFDKIIVDTLSSSPQRSHFDSSVVMALARNMFKTVDKKSPFDLLQGKDGGMSYDPLKNVELVTDVKKGYAKDLAKGIVFLLEEQDEKEVEAFFQNRIKMLTNIFPDKEEALTLMQKTLVPYFLANRENWAKSEEGSDDFKKMQSIVELLLGLSVNKAEVQKFDDRQYMTKIGDVSAAPTTDTRFFALLIKKITAGAEEKIRAIVENITMTLEEPAPRVKKAPAPPLAGTTEATFAEGSLREDFEADSMSRRTMQRSKQRREYSTPASEIVNMGEITDQTTAALKEETRELQRSRSALNPDDLLPQRSINQPTNQRGNIPTSEQPVFNIESDLESQTYLNVQPRPRRARTPKALEETLENNTLLYGNEI